MQVWDKKIKNPMKINNLYKAMLYSRSNENAIQSDNARRVQTVHQGVERHSAFFSSATISHRFRLPEMFVNQKWHCPHVPWWHPVQ